MKPNKMSK